MANWSDFLQNAAQQVIDTRLAVYQAEKIPQSIDTSSGIQYTDGQPLFRALSGVSPVVWVAGGAAVLLLAVFILKD